MDYPASFSVAAKIIHFFDEKPDIIWPNFNLHNTPIIVHEETPLLLGFNLFPNDQSWISTPDFGNAWINTQDFQNLHRINIHPAYPIENKFAYIFSLAPKGNISRRYQAFVHEKFHFFQYENFVLDDPGLFRDHLNLDIQWLIFLENAALMSLLDDITSEEKMKDVVAIFEKRRRLMHQDSVNWDRYQNRMEGIAEYVDVKTFIELPILEIPSLSILRDYSKKNFSDDISEIIDSSIKWRYYSVGAISGLALDVLELPNWKAQVTNNASPLEILSMHFNLSDAEIHDRVQKLESQFDVNVQKEKIIASIKSYQFDIDSIEKQYNEMPGFDFQWNVHLSCPSGAYSEKGYYLADGNRISLSTTSSELCKKENETYSADLLKHPIMYSYRYDGYRLKIDPAATIELNGKKIDPSMLEVSGKVNSLKIESETFSLSYQGNLCYQQEQGKTIFQPCS